MIIWKVYWESPGLDLDGGKGMVFENYTNPQMSYHLFLPLRLI